MTSTCFFEILINSITMKSRLFVRLHAVCHRSSLINQDDSIPSACVADFHLFVLYKRQTSRKIDSTVSRTTSASDFWQYFQLLH